MNNYKKIIECYKALSEIEELKGNMIYSINYADKEKQLPVELSDSLTKIVIEYYKNKIKSLENEK